jgi:hypothetical protein
MRMPPIVSALRYCAITFAYTAISILLNYSKCLSLFIGYPTDSVPVTPPNAVGIANGIAQSIVSLARCFGPVLGGYVSYSSRFSRMMLNLP